MLGPVENVKGQLVQKGTLLACLDSESYKLQVESARAQLEALQAQYDTTQTQIEYVIPAKLREGQATLILAKKNFATPKKSAGQLQRNGLG